MRAASRKWSSLWETQRVGLSVPEKVILSSGISNRHLKAKNTDAYAERKNIEKEENECLFDDYSDDILYQYCIYFYSEEKLPSSRRQVTAMLNINVTMFYSTM